MSKVNFSQLESLDDGYGLWRVVMGLEEEFRLVMMLHYFMKYPAREIARILRTDEDTVESRLSKAKQDVVEALR